MSIKIKRYNVILKLAVALAILGCFFIANGRTVKAAGEIVEYSTDTLGDDEYLKYTIKDAIDSITITYATGVDIVINSSSSAELKDKYLSVATHTLEKSDILKLVGDVRNSDPSKVGTLESNFHISSFKKGTTTYTSSDVKNTAPTKTLRIHTASVFDVSEGAVATVTPKATSVSNNTAYQQTENTSIVYYYAGAGIDFNVTTIPAGYRVKGWRKGTVLTYYWKELSFPTVEDESIALSPVFETDQITNIKVESTTAPNGFKYGDVSEKSFNVTIEGTNALLTKDYWSVTSGNATIVDYTQTAGESTGVLKVKLSSSAASGDVKLSVAVPNGKKDGQTYTQSDSFPIYDTLDGATSVKIDGDKNCARGKATSAYKILKNGNEFLAKDIKSITWNVVKYSGSGLAGKLLFGDSDETHEKNPVLTAKTDAGVNDVYRLTATVIDQFNVTKPLDSIDVTIVDPSITLALDLDEITNGYYMLGVVTDSPTGSLSDCKIEFSATNATATKPNTNAWYAIIKGNKVDVSGADADVTATAKKGTNKVSEDEGYFTVYPSPKDSTYDAPTRNLKIILPSPLNLGTVYSNGKDNNFTEVEYDYVTGYKLNVSRDGTSLYSTSSSTARNGNEGTRTVQFSSSSLEKIVTDNKSKFSGDQDSIDLTLNFYGSDDSDGEDAEIIEEPNGSTMTWTKNVPVYKVAIVGDSGLSSTTAYTYGLEGQEVSLAASVKSGYKITGWSDSTSYTSSTRKVTVSSDTSKNKYTVNTANSSSTSTSSSSTSKSTSSGTGRDYDDVPTTSESNAPIWLIIFMVFAVIGSGYALYMQLKPVSAQDDSYDEEDEE